MAVKALIKKMPAPVQTCARYAYGAIPRIIRNGKAYRMTSGLLQRSQWWSREELEAYQADRLSILLEHAYANVPYYTKLFDERKLKPADIRGPEDLKILPFLTREMIRENAPELIAKNYPETRLQYETTGGSTGIPLGFYYERGVTDEIEQAFIHALWSRVGFKPGHTSAVFRGKVIKNADWHYDPASRNLCFSTYHMTDENLWRYVDKIRVFRPDFIAGYPSAISVLANFMLRNKVEPFQSLKAVLCGSENLYPNLRDLMARAFGCRIFSWYGHTERAVLAGECESGTRYHIFPEYGVVELIGKDGRIITDAGSIGEVAATGLNNFAFPMIRYRTSDLASYSAESCSCGRAYPLLARVEGRLQEFIVTADGREVTLTSFVFAQHFKAFSRIKQMQIVQDKTGAITVRIARSSEYSLSDEDELRQVMLHTVNGRLEIDFDYVNEIEKTSSGKHRFLIQKLPVMAGGASA